MYSNCEYKNRHTTVAHIKPLLCQGQPKSKSKKFISFKKKKILTFQSAHAASEMAVAIGCFSVVTGVAIMLAVEDLNFLLKVI